MIRAGMDGCSLCSKGVLCVDCCSLRAGLCVCGWWLTDTNSAAVVQHPVSHHQEKVLTQA